ncbi:ubiquitin carboxyl-terminal hydrolase [Lecanosticta acicola]|uniref:Ubiquitin carboxyl-terminal hydrolase n=1 Tax=Lecanosticta acicola TaxID=111012 RepID=A0AAI9ECZ0_9PEZI|nr:ubiquitin carboxyl-terminal hydrolase [Lecanosticta acicola]
MNREVTANGNFKGMGKETKDDRFEVDTPASQACFANSALQILNAALSFEEIKKLRGNNPLSLFKYTYQELLTIFDLSGKLRVTHKYSKMLEKLRQTIALEGATSESGSIAIGPYLGQLLVDMREGVSHKSPKQLDRVNPLILQQVFAYGGREDRHQFDGDLQQDCHEYLMGLVNAVAERHPFMGKLFEVETSVRERCTVCNWERTSIVPQFGRTFQVPPSTIGLRDSIERHSSVAAEFGEKQCPTCEKFGTLVETTTVSKIGNHLVVALNRSGNNDHKVLTKIGLGDTDLRFEHGGNSYVAKAIIRHNGSKTTNGHYTALVEHQSSWHETDDLDCTKVTLNDLADRRKNLCSIVLFQKGRARGIPAPEDCLTVKDVDTTSSKAHSLDANGFVKTGKYVFFGGIAARTSPYRD